MDPKLEAFLNMLAARPAPELADLPLEEALRRFRSTVFVNPLPSGTQVRVEDGFVPYGAQHIRVRWYLPKATGALPTVVNIHGGGWVGGALEMDDYRCCVIAEQASCAVVSVDYSLAPEHRYPAALGECEAVIEWLQGSGRPRWVDPQRVGLLGSSAGGALGLGACLKARDRGAAPVKFLMLLYPAVDSDVNRPSYGRFGEGYSLTARQMAWFIEQYRSPQGEAEPGYFMPLQSASFANLPVTLLIGAEWDVLADEIQELAVLMRRDQVRVIYTVYGSTIHGFVSAIPDALESRLALRQCVDFVCRMSRRDDGSTG